MLAMPSRRFQRRREDFRCDHCGFLVRGSGYTNHCPHCLWSKHVDVWPGDRRADCRGEMEPVAVELIHDEFLITHQCLRCGLRKKNKAAPNDDRSIILKVTEKATRLFHHPPGPSHK